MTNQHLKNYQSEINIDEIWKAIEPQVDAINAARQQKRRGGWLFWLIAFAGVSTMTLSLFFFQSEVETTPASPMTVQESATPIASAPTPETMESLATIPTETKKHTKQETAPKAAVTSVRQDLSLGRDKNNNDLSLTKTSAPSFVPTTSPKNNKPTTNNSIATTPPQNSNSTTVSTTTPVATHFDNESIKSYDINFKNNSVVADKNSIIPNNAISNTVAIDALPALSLPFVNNKKQELIAPAFRPFDSEIGGFIEENEIEFALEIQAGASLSNRTLSLTNPALDTLFRLRSQLENSLDALHGSIMLQAHHPSGFYIGAGGAYTQIAEKYENNETATSTIQQEGIIKYTVTLNGDTIPMSGVIDVVQETTFEKRYYNKYQMIDIPVVFGYKYNFGEWSTDFSVGVFTNIILNTSGRIPQTPTEDLNLDNNGDQVFKSRVGHSWQFSAGFSRNITDNFAIRFNPNLRYYPKSLTKATYGIDQKYLLFGVNVGAVMKL